MVACVATVSKGAGRVAVLRHFLGVDEDRYGSVWRALGFVASESMIVGTFLALLQDNVTHLLAYLSLADLGVVLVKP